MDDTRVNNNIFTSDQEPLFTREDAADIIKYYSFNLLPEETPVWTPSLGKSINLTGVQVSAPLGVTITLSGGGSKKFLSLRVTNPYATINQYFSSSYRLKPDDAIFVSTSNEEIQCETSGAVSATQVNFNGRSDFTNVNNATGLPNGQFATLSSAILTATGGRIVLNYNIISKASSELQIERVVIKFYCRLSLTLAVGTSSMIFYWRPNTSNDWIELQQVSLSLIGTIDYLTTPLEQDITEEILAFENPWEVVGTLQTSFVGTHTGLGVGNTIQLDAVEVVICLTGKNKITLCGFET
jgi:hypothetical protein